MFQNRKGEALFYNGLIIGILEHDPSQETNLYYINIAGNSPNPYSDLLQ